MSKRPTWGRWIVIALLSAAAIIAYLGRGVLGVVSDEVQRDLTLTTVQMGWAKSAFFWGYALAQVPAGWLGQRYGIRYSLAAIAVFWSLACALIGASAGLVSLLAAQVLFGIAQAGIFPFAASAISAWVPENRRALATGSLGSCMSVGGALGMGLASLLVLSVGWRFIFPVYAIPGLVWAVAFAAWFRDQPADHKGVNEAELHLIRGGAKETEPARQRSAWSVFCAVVSSFDFWMVCGQQFFRAAGYIFYSTWFPSYLKRMHGVSTATSGLLASLPLLAIVAGSAKGGWLIDFVYARTSSRRLSRQGVAVIALSTCALCILAAYFVSNARDAMILITLGSYAFALGGPAAYTITIEKAGDQVAPVFGVMNMVGNLGAAACPAVVAMFVAQTGNWSLVLLLFVGIYAAAAGCWLLLNPEGSIFDSSTD